MPELCLLLPGGWVHLRADRIELDGSPVLVAHQAIHESRYGPNGVMTAPPKSSPNTSAVWRGSRTGIDRWWIMGISPVWLGSTARRQSGRTQ